MKKRLSAIILSLLLVLSIVALCACDGGLSKEELEALQASLPNAVTYVKEATNKLSATAYGDFDVISSIEIRGSKYAVDWEIQMVTAGAQVGENTVAIGESATTGFTKIAINELSSTEFQFKLIGTVHAAIEGAEEVTQTLDAVTFTKPACIPMSFAEIEALEGSKGDGTAVTVTGVITAMASEKNGDSRNNIWFQNADGGAYEVYQCADDPVELGLAVGDSVCAMGSYKYYYGVHELESASYFMLEKGDASKVPAPIDITEACQSAPNLLNSEGLLQYCGKLVTIKGVKISGENTNQGYYSFKFNGVESYVRISSSECPLVAADEETFKTTHAEKFGWTANATGIVNFYSNLLYLIPTNLNAYEYIEYVEATDAEKIAEVKASLELLEKTKKDVEIELASKGTSYEEVAISWAFAEGYTPANEGCVEIKEGKLNIKLGEKADQVKVVATLTSGTTSDTKEFTIEVEALPSAPTSEYAITDVDLGLAAYAAGEATIDGIKYAFVELGSYGNGIQMRIKNDNTAELKNVDAYKSGITKIVLTYNKDKSTYDNADAFSFKFGTTAEVSDYEVKLSTVAGEKVYEITPDKDTYTFFDMKLLLTYSFYWDSIVVYTKPVATESSTEITDAGLGLAAYAAGEATIDGIKYSFVELGSYGNGIQMRIKNDNTAELKNVDAYKSGITKIVLTYNKDKSTYDNADAFSFKFGTTAEVADYEVKLSTVAGEKVYEITPDKDTYTFFDMKLLLTYSFYWDSIVVYTKPVATAASTEITDVDLGLAAYAAGEATIDGIKYSFVELGSYGNGIQMRIKNDNTAELKNVDAYKSGIAKIVLTYNKDKSTYDNADAFSFKFGTTAEVSDYEVKLSTVAGEKVYEITPDKDSYTFFDMKLLLTYSFYWDSIEIVFVG